MSSSLIGYISKIDGKPISVVKLLKKSCQKKVYHIKALLYGTPSRGNFSSTTLLSEPKSPILKCWTIIMIWNYQETQQTIYKTSYWMGFSNLFSMINTNRNGSPRQLDRKMRYFTLTTFCYQFTKQRINYYNLCRSCEDLLILQIS